MRTIAFWCMTFLLLVLAGGCSMPDKILKEPYDPKNTHLLRIAYGSCNNHEKSQAYWKNIADYYGDEHVGYPEVWIWAGDIVYADTESHAILKAAYEVVKNSEYRTFEQGCKRPDCRIVGVWDDHDFGDNNLVGDLGPEPVDSPFEEITKPERRALLLDFLDEPTRSMVKKQEQVYPDYKQVYVAYNFEHDGVSIRLILLDLRYDRQKPGADAKIMGQAQWDWLEENLKDERVDLHLIVSSTQVLRKDTRKDTWGEYPKQRRKLLELIGLSPAQGIVLLTGDIHAAEISRLGNAEQAEFLIDFPLYEITASGLNRLRCFLSICNYNWDNPYQEGFVKKHNFGEIDVAKSDDGTLRLVATLRSPESPEAEILLQKIIQFAPR